MASLGFRVSSHSHKAGMGLFCLGLQVRMGLSLETNHTEALNHGPSSRQPKASRQSLSPRFCSAKAASIR